MKNIFVALIVGFTFSLGLGISGMTKPEKVMGFLDVFGNWDPTLIFVMAGAIAVHSIAYQLTMRRTKPLFDNEWHLPKSKNVSKPLMIGSFIFGIGWGLGGYCPGPAVTSLGSLQYRPALFVISMVVGMLAFKWLNPKLHR